MSDKHEQADLSRVETALKVLRPAQVNIHSDQLMYRAGRAALARQAWRWSAAAALGGLVLGFLASYQALRLSLQPQERIVYVSVPEKKAPAVPLPVPSAEKEAPQLPMNPPSLASNPSLTVTWLEIVFPTNPKGYLALRQQMLRWGVDHLPEPSSSASGIEKIHPSSLFELNRELEERPSQDQLFPSFLPYFQN